MSCFGTAYGWTWLTALVVTILTYLFGLFVIVPALRRMDQAPVAADGAPTPGARRGDRPGQAARRIGAGRLLVIFTCMILMRFGL